MDWTESFPEAARLIRNHATIPPGEVVVCDGVILELSPDVLSPMLTRTTRFFARALHAHDGATIAEIGVGAGYTLALLGKRYSGLQMVGSDINISAVSLAARNLRRNGLSAQLAVGHLFAPDLPDFPVPVQMRGTECTNPSSRVPCGDGARASVASRSGGAARHTAANAAGVR